MPGSFENPDEALPRYAACVTVENKRGSSVQEVGPLAIQIMPNGIWVPEHDGFLRTFFPWHRVNWIADYSD